MTVYIASDHGGVEHKELIKAFLAEKGIAVEDLGVSTTDSVDYPDYAEKVCRKIQESPEDRGILVCGTGIGMSIAANKFQGIRAALVGDCFSAKATREHNDTNVLCLGQRVIGGGLALMIVDIWLNTAFLDQRHQQRLDKISEIEQH
ncbi:ribose 5-phosphate isomerase B [Vagococcus acidifermentans]|uniref:Ribose 5-phosphate isomerase B n=1 Tax=Vagococcus acidifermentans TaxID=564710 RepID=A0A430B370_9ENTE|nr:ribose 5-phosphate isomerase B [Vagococcus acidifermentans]RSU14642.1 ribose 5-phosphate isomerase B [Vagococcus acidifermentans]